MSPIDKIRAAHPEWAKLCNICAAIKAGVPLTLVAHGPAGGVIGGPPCEAAAPAN